MKQLKPLIRLLLLFVGVIPAFSQTAPLTATNEAPAINFVVWTHSGERITYPLSEHPVVTHIGDKLKLSTHTGAVEYTATEVRKFTFEPIYYFVAWLSDGSRYAYALDQHPVVTYSNGELLLSTSQEQIAYPADDVHKFTFSLSDITDDGQKPPATQISSIEQENQYHIRSGEIQFSNCHPGSPIHIYTLDGKLLHTATVATDGRANIDTSTYPAGVYIIKTETITHKIIKR